MKKNKRPENQIIQKVASNVYARNYATNMLQLGMERGGGEGRFVPQVGTNLTARSGTRVFDQSTPSEGYRTGDAWDAGAGIGMQQKRGSRSDPAQLRRSLLPAFLPSDSRTKL